eukprot:Awhi_evm3s14606
MSPSYWLPSKDFQTYTSENFRILFLSLGRESISTYGSQPICRHTFLVLGQGKSWFEYEGDFSTVGRLYASSCNLTALESGIFETLKGTSEAGFQGGVLIGNHLEVINYESHKGCTTCQFTVMLDNPIRLIEKGAFADYPAGHSFHFAKTLPCDKIEGLVEYLQDETRNGGSQVNRNSNIFECTYNDVVHVFNITEDPCNTTKIECNSGASSSPAAPTSTEASVTSSQAAPTSTEVSASSPAAPTSTEATVAPISTEASVTSSPAAPTSTEATASSTIAGDKCYSLKKPVVSNKWCRE